MVGLDSAGKVSQSLEGCVVQRSSMTAGLSSGGEEHDPDGIEADHRYVSR